MGPRGRIRYRKLRGGYRDDRTEAAGSRSDGDTPTRLSLAPPVTPNSAPGEFRYPRPPVPSIGATVVEDDPAFPAEVEIESGLVAG
jgi:hypothetical protein